MSDWCFWSVLFWLVFWPFFSFFLIGLFCLNIWSVLCISCLVLRLVLSWLVRCLLCCIVVSCLALCCAECCVGCCVVLLLVMLSCVLSLRLSCPRVVSYFWLEGLANPTDKFTVFYAERSPWWVIVKAKVFVRTIFVVLYLLLSSLVQS